MVGVKFIEDFANKVVDDRIVVDGQLASQLIAEGVAILDPVQTEAVAATILSKKKVK
jgi:hypothetical protein